jgi:ornithine carbamoyltransferase
VKKDFLEIPDMNTEEIYEIFALAGTLKKQTKSGKQHHLLKGQTLAMIFQKPSARTRVSFQVGMYQLGGHALYLSPNDIGLGTRESVPDVARVFSRYNDGIMARVFAHDYVVELGQYASIPVINGLSDLLHPCQVMADMFTILEKRGNLDGLKLAYIGDGNNMTNSWLHMACRIPMQLHLAIPEGYDPDQTIISKAKNSDGSEINLFRDPREAIKEVEFIYTDVWASMGQESEAQERKKIFKDYQINDSLLKHARPDVKVMHCLPAHRGDEITNEVMEGPHSIVFEEAENRLHVQKAIMVKLMKK